MNAERKVTLYEADLYEKEDAKEESVQFIIFRVAAEWYGVEITKVKEVVRMGKVSFLPSAPTHIAGIVHSRGSIMSVTDLKRIFDLHGEDPGRKSRLVVVSSGALETCLLVDEVAEPAEVAVSKIDPELTTVDPEKAGFIEGEFKINDKLVGILKVEKILEKSW